jgi:hypothetical protein
MLPPFYCWWECKLVQLLWKSVWRFLKKLKVELPYDAAIPLLGVHLKEYKPAYNRDTCRLMFTAALVTIPSHGISLVAHQWMNG